MFAEFYNGWEDPDQASAATDSALTGPGRKPLRQRHVCICARAPHLCLSGATASEVLNKYLLKVASDEWVSLFIV